MVVQIVGENAKINMGTYFTSTGMESQGDASTDGSATRRRFLTGLGTGAVATMGGMAGCIDSVSSGGGETTTTTSGSDSVQFVHSSALTGTYVDMGEEEQLGFKLAVRHLNEGGGLVDEGVFESLTGDGVLGRTVDGATVDTGGKAEEARSNLSPYLSEDDVAMFCGGVSGEVVKEHRAIADEQELPYMAGMSLLKSLSGGDCSPHVYREQAPSDAVIRALGPTLNSEFEGQQSYEHLYVDTPEGNDLVDSINQYFSTDAAPNWNRLGSIPTRRGNTNMEEEVATFNQVDLDVLFCSLFGLDAINLLTEAAKNLNDNTTIVVPWINQSIAETVQEDVADVIGTVPWDAGVDSTRSTAFADSYRAEAAIVSGSPSNAPTGPAHHMYCQTLMFAAAAERAGSFDSADVRSELEGLTYDVGFGEQTMQACNHQASKPIPVVRGQAEATSTGSWFEVISVEEGMVGGCDEPPASNCSISE